MCFSIPRHRTASRASFSIFSYRVFFVSIRDNSRDIEGLNEVKKVDFASQILNILLRFGFNCFIKGSMMEMVLQQSCSSGKSHTKRARDLCGNSSNVQRVCNEGLDRDLMRPE